MNPLLLVIVILLLVGGGGFYLGGPAIGHVSLNDAVHWTALLILPVLLYGYVELGRSLDLRRPIVLLAVCTLVASLFAGMGAATMSGLVMADVAGAAQEREFGPETLDALRHLTFWINQGFATVHYVLLALGIGLFAWAWPNRPEDRGLKYGGLVLAVGFMIWLATGHWGADVHSVLIVVAASAIWSIMAGLAQRSLPDEG